jgi:uncharacterized membrane protein
MAVGLRSWRERAIQVLAFEALGLLLVTPLYGWATGATTADSLRLLLALSGVVMAWAAAYNTVFDWTEHRLTRRLASDRPHAWRLVHAGLGEATAVVVSCPVIVAMTGLGWWEALVADLALTLVYAAYGYVYHWVFDRLRPMRPTQPPPGSAR